MFSGIVEELALVEDFHKSGTSKLRIRSALNHAYTKIGDSICINGVCLTVVKMEAGILDFELSEETLRRSNLANLQNGSQVNLERSLIVGDRIHGHFVFGHVDGLIELRSVKEMDSCCDLEFTLPDSLRRFVAEKGSVSINGVSLTVSSVGGDSFTISAIPHTLSVTNLGLLRPADKVNFEADMLARYVLNRQI